MAFLKILQWHLVTTLLILVPLGSTQSVPIPLRPNTPFASTLSTVNGLTISSLGTFIDVQVCCCLPNGSTPAPPLQSPTPLAISHPLQSPPPPGDRHFHVFLVNIYCAGLCCPSALHMALHCFPITSDQSPVCIL